MAREIDDLDLLCCQELRGLFNCQLQVFLRVLVNIYAHKQVSPAHKLQLWCGIVKTSNLHDVTNPVPI